MEKNFYLVVRPSMKGTTIPVYYYTFAENEEAIKKISLKWGEYDPKAFAREQIGQTLDELVIATDYIG